MSALATLLLFVGVWGVLASLGGERDDLTGRNTVASVLLVMLSVTLWWTSHCHG